MIYTHDDLQAVYQKMGDALLKSGRPIVYSLCEYGSANVELWGAKVGGNLWRTTCDISDSWTSMIANIENQVPTAPFAGPGHWNDPDMLKIRNGHMTDEEYRTHMSLWALTAAPLLAGNDIRSMTPAIKAILTNREVLAVDQDADLGSNVSGLDFGLVSGGIYTFVSEHNGLALDNGNVTANTVRSSNGLWTFRRPRRNNGRSPRSAATPTT